MGDGATMKEIIPTKKRHRLLISAAIMLTFNMRLLLFDLASYYQESYSYDIWQRVTDQSKFPAPPYKFKNDKTFLEFWNASHYRKYHALWVETKWNNSGLPKQAHPPSMLLGITTQLNSRTRRQLIRDTYLNYYNDIGDTKFRICSLNEIIAKRWTVNHCRLTYTFVAAGGTNDSPTSLLRKSDPSVPMTISGPVENSNEDDVIYLNIRDNMNEGKIPTWFKYASQSIDEEYGLRFDYIAKIDDDTILFTGNWMDAMDRQLPKPRQANLDGLVYGGFVSFPFDAWHGECLQGVWEKCPLIGPLWMLGSFYFLSRELALYTISDLIDHESISYVEDVSTASYVWSHPGNITVVEMNRQHNLISYDLTSYWTEDRSASRFRAIIAHSEDACWNPTGPYFKQPGNVKKVWREYLAFIWSGRKLSFYSRYILHDYAPPHVPAALTSVHPSDYIYSSDDFDASPIVLGDPFNLVFFPITGVADIAWRCVIRRLLGYEDWSDPNRQFHGLTYLSNFSIVDATNIMYSPKFTRAMFVRNPIKRIQSNYIKLVLHDPEFTMLKGCDCARQCDTKRKSPRPCHAETQTFQAFLKDLIPYCDQPYWRPQADRMEPKYYELIDFVGRYSSFALDTETLLKQVIPKAQKKLDAFAWVDQSHLQDMFEQFDQSYSDSDVAAILFNSTWKTEFKNIFPNDMSSDILQRTRDPSKTQKKKKKKTAVTAK